MKRVLPLGLILIVLPFYLKTPLNLTINNISEVDKKNNVILIIVDTARKDCIDLESTNTVTPNLKQLAEDGIVLEKFIANGAWTPPAHASLFTGLLPSEHGVFHYENAPGVTVLSDKLFTLAEILQKNGINTVGFFSNPYLSEELGFAQGFKQYRFIPPDVGSITNYIIEMNLNRLKKYFPKYFSKLGIIIRKNYNNVALSNKVLHKPAKWVIKNGSKQDFFVFINLMEQHYIRYFHDPIETKLCLGPYNYFESLEQRYLKPESMRDRNKELLEWHKTTIKNVDYYLGNFIDILKKHKLYKNTTIIVTSDHGDLFGEWDHYGHESNIYAPNVFVPFIIKYANSFSERKIHFNRIFQQADVFAEILDLFEISVPSNVFGKPFTLKKGNPVITQLYRKKETPNSLKKIIDRDLCGTYLNLDGDYYQLIYSTNGKHEMYRIHYFNYTDTNNLYVNFIENPLVLQFINICPKLLMRRINKTKPIKNEDVLKRLKSLGYIH